MSAPPPVHLAGYQGPRSILTASLEAIAAQLAPAFGAGNLRLEANITASGETAASLFGSVDGGARQICYIATGYLAARVPELAALDLPFTVRSRSAVFRALDGAAGEVLTKAIEARTGYKVLGFWDNGFRHLTNGVRPIRSPADCTGLSIRTLDSAIYREALAALGFLPRSIDVKDLVRVVQSREVDAQENPLTNTFHFGLHRHHPYVSLTGHFFSALLLVCNRAWFASLSTPQQDALCAGAADATHTQRQQAASEDDSMIHRLREAGAQILPAAELDLAAMQRATRFIVDRECQALAPDIVRHYLDEVMR